MSQTLTTKLKITQIGNSVGVVLPKDVLAKLRVDKGDTVTLTETPEGVHMTAFDEEFATQMELAEKIMREDRDVLKKLAQ